MKNRSVGAILLGGLALGIMGMGVPRPDAPAPRGLLGRHPFFYRLGGDLPAMEREVLLTAGAPAGRDLAQVLTLVEAWRKEAGLTACGHPEEHELSGTACSRSPGSALDALFARVVGAWYRGGHLDAVEATLLYGGLPPFLATTHVLRGDQLERTLATYGPEAIRAERDRLVATGLSGARHWTPEAVVESLERRRDGGDLGAARARLNPEGRDLRRDVMEGVVRPLGLVAGATGLGGEPVFAYVERGRAGPLAPLRPPAPAPPVEDAPAIAEAPPAIEEAPAPEPARAGLVEVNEVGFAVGYGGSRFR